MEIRTISVDRVKELIYQARNNCRGDPNEMEKILYDSLSNSRPSSADNKDLTKKCPKCLGAGKLTDWYNDSVEDCVLLNPRVLAIIVLFILFYLYLRSLGLVQ